MKLVKELTVEQMAKRVLTKIPELDHAFVVASIQEDTQRGRSAFSVQSWLEYFDSILIDSKGELTVGEKAI